MRKRSPKSAVKSGTPIVGLEAGREYRDSAESSRVTAPRKPSPAKSTAPNIPAEAGREYRDTAEQALATATPGELRERAEYFGKLAVLTTEIGKKLESQCNSTIRGAATALKVLQLGESTLSDQGRAECLAVAKKWLDEIGSLPTSSVAWPSGVYPDETGAG